MFDVGFWELILIFGVGLLILGPERLPRVAARIGLWIGRAQRTANQFRRKLQRELELDDLVREGLVPGKRPVRPAEKKTPTAAHDTSAAGATAAAAQAQPADEPTASRSAAPPGGANQESGVVRDPAPVPEPRSGEVRDGNAAKVQSGEARDGGAAKAQRS